MGIPFYFASLTKSHVGIIEAVKRGMTMNVDVLGIDFNCLIHRYLKDEDPITSVISALEHIVETICKPKQLIIAFDGLVPYAKMVNQRYRRMRAKESTGAFDRNMISPDTPYMRELEEAVRAKFPYAILSPTQDAGEGEHKLFTEIEKIPQNSRRSVVIYGLDADLILLSLQHHKLSFPYSMYLLRESAEFDDPKVAKAEFATLSIWKLLKQLPMDIDNYMALSVLCFGNDFMPNLGMFSLREDGYDRALHLYEECGKPNLLSKEGRAIFLKAAAFKEFTVLRERGTLRKRPEERAILGKDNSSLIRKYGLHVLDGVTDMKPVVEAYWITFHWTMYYFRNGTPANWTWVYPYPDAPLVTSIVSYAEPESIEGGECKLTLRNQLTFILPEASLKKTRRKVLFPDEIYSETRNPWMKRHDWEMKPRISLPWNPEYTLTSIELFANDSGHT
jgi:5'-3' exonuclease